MPDDDDFLSKFIHVDDYISIMGDIEYFYENMTLYASLSTGALLGVLSYYQFKLPIWIAVLLTILFTLFVYKIEVKKIRSITRKYPDGKEFDSSSEHTDL